MGRDIKTYSVDCSLSPGSGVIVQATVNGRAEHPNVWVEKIGQDPCLFRPMRFSAATGGRG